jgi:DNA polymerase
MVPTAYSPGMGTMPTDLEFWFLDFETFYSSDYTLRSLDPPSYILDPRFEAICLGVAKGFTDPPFLIDGPDIPQFLSTLPPNVAAVSHNALFDMAILSWRYGWVPKLIVDTLAMARTLLAHLLKRLDLGTVAKYIGLVKGNMVQTVKGMTRADIIANGLWDEEAAYCLGDTAICRAIFLHLLPLLPPEELILHDIIARCAIQPALRLDIDLLAQHLGEVQWDKQKLFMNAMFAGLEDKAQLMSNPQFADLLQNYAVDPPMKISKTTGLLTYAFSRTDPEFLALLEHEDPRVVAIVEARLGHKSTIEETRTQRMINIGSLDFPHHGGTGVMPIPLIVGAAHTHRLGGGWKLNCQNWGRTSPIRKSIKAPPGHKLVVADARQIECRTNAEFCGQENLLEEFRRNEDVYQNFADSIGVIRFIGKIGVLQLGYQAGWQRFQQSVWVESFKAGSPVWIENIDAERVVNGYRNRYSRINAMWHWLPKQFGTLAGAGPAFEYRSVRFEKGRIVGPTGLCLYYDNMQFDDGQWWFTYGGVKTKIYGGKFLENVIQFLSRCKTMRDAVRLKKPLEDYHTRLTHTSHDELVYVVPEKHVDTVKQIVHAEMCLSPPWAPDCPLDCEVGVGDTYGDAK